VFGTQLGLTPSGFLRHLWLQETRVTGLLHDVGWRDSVFVVLVELRLVTNKQTDIKMDRQTTTACRLGRQHSVTP